MRIVHVLSAISVALGSMAAVAASESPVPASAATEVPMLFIVQAPSAAAAEKSVELVKARVEQQFEIIHAVSAYLTHTQVEQLQRSADVRIFADRPVSTRSTTGLTSLTSGLFSTVNQVTSSVNNTVTSSFVGTVTGEVTAPVVSTVTTVPLLQSVTSPLVTTFSGGTSLQDGSGVSSLTLLYQTNYPQLVGADDLQRAGITGKGVTIAVLDSGLWQDVSQNYGGRLLASVDVLNGGSGPVRNDTYGHGTHVTSIAASGAQNLAGGYLGIAPKANLVVVRAFDGTGGGRYVDVIAGLNWIVGHRQQYNIRVLNMSFGAPALPAYRRSEERRVGKEFRSRWSPYH